MNAKSFNLSIQGASHIKKNKECQDASASYFDEKMAVAIVCDGHGGDDYMRSAAGSLLASAVAKKNIINFLNTISKEQFMANPEKNLRNLEASIINGWNESIKIHLNQTPFSESELNGISEKARKKYEEGRIESAYGTTLIAVAMTNEFWFGIHIGDGKCVAVNPEGKFVQPIPWDLKCFLNTTTSMCDSDALDRFRHFYSEKLPVAVFVGSDGIDDCFKNNEQLHNFYKTILYSFGTSDFEVAKEELKDYLPRLSAKGSGDDVSIAAMFDFDLVPEMDVVKDFDREKEKARVEENAQKEAEKNEAERKRIEEEHARFQQKNNSEAKATGKTMKFCIECGGKLVPGKKFCPSCGTKIDFKTIKQEPPKTEIEIQVITINKGEVQDILEVSDTQVKDESLTDEVIEVKSETGDIADEVDEAVDIISGETALIDGDMSASQTKEAKVEECSAEKVEAATETVEETEDGEVVFDNTAQEGVDGTDGETKIDEIV